MEAGRPTIGLKEKKARLLRIIDDCKLRIEAEIKRYKSALKNLRTEVKRYDAAYSKYVKRPNEKNIDLVEEALSAVRASDSIRETVSLRIRTLRETADRANTELVELLGGLESKAANAYNTNFVKYVEKLEKLLHSMERTILDSRPGVADGEYTFGVRPENLCIGNNGQMPSIKATILQMELLGANALVYLDYKGLRLCAKIEVDESLKIGQEVELTCDLKRCHLFDSETGARV